MDLSGLEEFILDRMRRTRIPGLSIALVRGGEVVYARGFGFRDLNRGIPATPGTIYGIGSITKSFTAIAVMRLVEEGELGLDDPIDRYVPLKLRPKGEPVTIHHLLTHTSGIPALAYAEAFIRGSLGLSGAWLPLASPEDVIAFMRGSDSWAEARPGERFFYLNEGYVLLGYIISKLTGTGYEDYVKKHILEPLGMRRTYFREEEVRRDPDVAVPYIVDREGRHVEGRFPYGITSDGGLLSNALDMSRYIAMLINRGELGEARILGRESLELMEKGYASVPWRVFGDESYGYGLVVTNRFLGDKKLVQHGGSVLVYTAYMGYMPEDRLGVIVLANSSGYPLRFIGMYALALALGRDPMEIGYLRRERILESLEGVYEAYKGTHRYTVKRQGDMLVLHYSDRYQEQTIPLIPEELSDDYARFYTLSNGARITAEFYRRGDDVILIFERYKLVRRSALGA